ncbi:MAG: carboxylating nicotinate-nucleotide diphosphorylase [Candidatus Omnitrophota bacterium]
MNYNNLIKATLKEDLGLGRDITTQLLVDKNEAVKAIILAKENFIVCGINIAKLTFQIQDKKIKFRTLVKDGKVIKSGQILARLFGPAQSILTAERVALNFLSLLSGIASKTKIYTNVIKPYKTKILDTRKTIPGLRELEKYAVRIGGGYNHRMKLDSMILVKDNHLKIIGGIKNLGKIKSKKKIEIEVKTINEFKEALKLNPDIIMLDNMPLATIKKIVKLNKKKILLEASGGINLKNIKKIASCGVDMISIGNLTHSIKSVDVSLEIVD